MSISISGNGSITGVLTSYTFDKSVSVGGTLTYEDVTNVDSVGIITAQSGVVIGTGTSIGNPTTNELGLYTNSSERIRIDSSGRLLVGTSSDSQETTLKLQGSSAGTGDRPVLRLSIDATPAATDSTLSVITAENSAASAGASIVFKSDGAWTNGTSHPTRVEFSTTAGSASSPTERMRITSAGYLKASNTGSYWGSTGTYHEFNDTDDSPVLLIYNSNASFSKQGINGGVSYTVAARSATSAYSLAVFLSNGGTDVEFNLRGDGNAYADGSWNGGGADYAEYFEWSDGNPDEEDRRGISVVLDGDKIRPAIDGEDPIGVISGNPSVVGDAAWNKWSGKYLRDDYGTYIQEDYEVVNDEGEIFIQQRRKLNPAYDSDQEYINREDRPEWDCVGLMGKLRIRKGQPTGSRWIKMRDISDSVEEWLVR